MSNRNYTASSVPAFGAALTSATIRNEFGSISTGFTGVESELDGKVTLTTTQSVTGQKTFTAPILGAATATSINKVTLTTPATGCTLTIAEGKTYTVSNTLTLTGIDGSTLAIGTGGTLGTAAYTAATDYAVTAKGVTNGDSHDHNGGDGAQIAYSGLSDLPTLGTMAAQNTGTYAGPGSSQAFACGALTVTGSVTATGTTYQDDTKTGISIKDSQGTILFDVRMDGFMRIGASTFSPYSYTTASAANLYVGSDGALQRSTSSLKYKRNVQDTTHGLSELLELRPVTYQGKSEQDGDTVFGGLIAEEVHAAGLTEFVQYAEDGTPDALAYGQMVSLCIKAIQELSSRLAALENK